MGNNVIVKPSQSGIVLDELLECDGIFDNFVTAFWRCVMDKKLNETKGFLLWFEDCETKDLIQTNTGL